MLPERCGIGQEREFKRYPAILEALCGVAFTYLKVGCATAPLHWHEEIRAKLVQNELVAPSRNSSTTKQKGPRLSKDRGDPS